MLSVAFYRATPAFILAFGFAIPVFAAPAEPVIPLCGTNSSTPCGTAANPVIVSTGGSGSTVTANQGTPAVVGNAWPVTLAVGGALNSSSNPIFVTGGVAQGSATSGQTGSVIQGAVTTDPPTYVAGTTNPVSISLSGGVRVAPNATISGGGTYAHIAAGQATTTVKSGEGTLYSITFNGPATATNTTTVYDNTAGSGTVIAIPLATAAAAPTTINYGPVGLAFGTGLTIVTAAANGSDMTVVYK